MKGEFLYTHTYIYLIQTLEEPIYGETTFNAANLDNN
jgi:hypothetical protein